MCKAIYWGFMSVASWLVAPVKMRYPSNPFWCVTLSNFKYAHCPRIFPYSAQVVLVLFVSSHSISRRHQFQGYQIVLKKKRAVVYNKQRRTANPGGDTVSSEKYWLHIKNQIAAKMRRCLRLELKVENIKNTFFFFSRKSVSKPINARRRDERVYKKRLCVGRKKSLNNNSLSSNKVNGR